MKMMLCPNEDVVVENDESDESDEPPMKTIGRDENDESDESSKPPMKAIGRDENDESNESSKPPMKAIGRDENDESDESGEPPRKTNESQEKTPGSPNTSAVGMYALAYLCFQFSLCEIIWETMYKWEECMVFDKLKLSIDFRN